MLPSSFTCKILKTMSAIKVAQQKLSNAEGDPLPFNLTDVDRATLAQSDEDFIPHSWEELKDIVGLYPIGSPCWMNDSRFPFCHAKIRL